ncbi:MAG: type II secretion system minor pseudopilin GspJ [Gammaproteobacteria bacterium]
MKPVRGFTLIELMVVLIIFSVLAVLAYGGLNSVLTARERVQQSLERTTALQKAYLRLRNDLQQLRARPARDGFGDPQAALILLPDGAVEFTRSGWRNPLGQPRSALERVAYRLDGERRLLRVSWRALDRAQDATVSEVVVLDRVEEIRWRFLEGEEWRDGWPVPGAGASPALDAVPRAVELVLTLEDLGDVRLLFSASNEKPA